MFRRSLLLLALAALAAGSAQPALATGPTCSAHTPSLRYKPEYTATCSANILAVTVVKTSNGKTVGIGAPAGNSAGHGKALNGYCNHGHGVVLAGQTHWTAAGAGWNVQSSVGFQGGPWEKHWSLYYYEDMPADRVIGGVLASGSVKPHFLT